MFRLHPGRASVAVALVCLASVPAAGQCPPITMPEEPPTFLREWGSQGSAPEQFNFPYGVAIDASGNVWVTDLWNHKVKKFTPDGSLLAVFGGFGTGDTQLNAPAQIAFDATGNWYVTERHDVKMYDADGNFIRKWGQEGSGDGEFGIPDGIGVGPYGNVYVVDHNNSRVQKFTPEGLYLTQWTSAQMFHPHGLAIADDETIYISGGGTSKVLKFDLDGNHLLTFGVYRTYTDCAVGGEFWHTVGLGLDSNGNLYVSDSFNLRIQKFTAAESFLSLWGVLGAAAGEFGDPGPGHVAIAQDGTIYVADSGNHRIQVFQQSSTSAIEMAGSSWGRLKSQFRESTSASP